MPVSPARAAAFDILLRVERESSYASDLLHSAAYERLSTPDHALATELVMGVLRWRSRLDDDIATASSQPLSKLDLEILIALRLALYQFLWLDRVPQRAALHESVELVKRARKRSAAPFVNAVLRKLSPTPAIKPNMFGRRALFPRNPGSRTRASAMAGRALGPRIRTLRRSPDLPTQSIHSRPPQSAFAPPSRGRATQQEGITLSPGALLASARRVQAGDITKTQAFRTGQIVIQDEASQLVAALVGSSGASRSSTAAPLPAARRSPSPTTIPQPQSPPSNFIPTARACCKSCCTRMPSIRTNPNRHRRRAASPAVSRRSIVFSPTSPAPAPARSPAIPKSSGGSRPTISQSCTSARSQSSAPPWPKSRPADASSTPLVRWKKKKTKMSSSKLCLRTIRFRLLDCRTELDRLKAAGELTWPDPSSSRAAPTFARSRASIPATASSPLLERDLGMLVMYPRWVESLGFTALRN